MEHIIVYYMDKAFEEGGHIRRWVFLEGHIRIIQEVGDL
jgi:hypothetical protein